MNQRIDNEVQVCVRACKDAEYPFRCVFEFVRKLVDQNGWTEEEARQVGTKALKLLDR